MPTPTIKQVRRPYPGMTVAQYRAAVAREQAFRDWRDSGWSDLDAHARFIAAYNRANDLHRRTS